MTALPPRPTHNFNPLKFSPPLILSVSERRHLIELEAYLRAARRGFDPGHELADWLVAEAEIAERLAMSSFTMLG